MHRDSSLHEIVLDVPSVHTWRHVETLLTPSSGWILRPWAIFLAIIVTGVTKLVFRSVLLSLTNVSDKLGREYKDTNFVISNYFFENVAFYKIMLKSLYSRASHRCFMRISLWILMATNTHWEYVLLIDFPLQQWLHEERSNVTFIRTLTVRVGQNILQ